MSYSLVFELMVLDMGQMRMAKMWGEVIKKCLLSKLMFSFVSEAIDLNLCYTVLVDIVEYTIQSVAYDRVFL
jgi:hypothetical protein